MGEADGERRPRRYEKTVRTILAVADHDARIEYIKQPGFDTGLLRNLIDPWAELVVGDIQTI